MGRIFAVLKGDIDSSTTEYCLVELVKNTIF